MSQCAEILEYLGTGNPLTPVDALRRFGCLRLAARIADLRASGHLIVSETMPLHNGKRVARYWLVKSARRRAS